MDVIEIDAASNRKVEDAQNILEKIQYVPVNGKYKIYIIDEVHMLTNHAFNALLKTLEEPPENVIFILATTEPHKVLETITSRCQRFDFRRITTEDIVNHLKNIAKLEKIKIEDDALFTIAKNAAGGMRDSLALLDQVSVLDDSKKITSEDINRLLGRLSFDMLLTMAQNIIESKPQAAIELLEKIYNSGNEPTQILLNMLAYFKNLLIVKNCSGEELLLDLTQLNTAQLKSLGEQAEQIETHQITFVIEKIIYYIKELKTTTNQHLWLEVAIIDLANLAQNTSLLELQERITKLESGVVEVPKRASAPARMPQRPVEQVAPPPAEIKESKTEEKEVPEKPVAHAPKAEETPSPIQAEEDFAPVPVAKHKEASDSGLSDMWIGLLQNISSTPTVSLLSQHSVPVEISTEKVIIGCKENFLKLISSDSKRKSLEEGIKKYFGKDVSLVIRAATADELAGGEKKNKVNSAPKAAEKPIKTVALAPVEQEISSIDDSDDVSDEDDYVEHELAKVSKQDEKYVPSDQVSMVIKLFDGKYID
jgi:DNA polymerase-3 subunit gamma/tau